MALGVLTRLIKPTKLINLIRQDSLHALKPVIGPSQREAPVAVRVKVV